MAEEQDIVEEQVTDFKTAYEEMRGKWSVLDGQYKGLQRKYERTRRSLTDESSRAAETTTATVAELAEVRSLMNGLIDALGAGNEETSKTFASVKDTATKRRAEVTVAGQKHKEMRTLLAQLDGEADDTELERIMNDFGSGKQDEAIVAAKALLGKKPDSRDEELGRLREQVKKMGTVDTKVSASKSTKQLSDAEFVKQFNAARTHTTDETKRAREILANL